MHGERVWGHKKISPQLAGVSPCRIHSCGSVGREHGGIFTGNQTPQSQLSNLFIQATTRAVCPNPEPRSNDTRWINPGVYLKERERNEVDGMAFENPGEMKKKPSRMVAYAHFQVPMAARSGPQAPKTIIELMLSERAYVRLSRKPGSRPFPERTTGYTLLTYGVSETGRCTYSG